MNSLRKIKNKKGNNIVITTSWDDFREADERLLNLLYLYNLPATIYIPYKEVLEKHKLKLAKLASEYCEIGSHTINHPVLTKIPKPEQYAEIIDSKSMLEDLLGVEVKSFCYPKGRYNDKIVNILRNAGYTSARTVDVGNITIPEDPFRTKTTAHALSNRREYNGQLWVRYATDKLEEVMENGGYFHLWGHSWELDKYREWETLEYFFKLLSKKINENLSSE